MAKYEHEILEYVDKTIFLFDEPIVFTKEQSMKIIVNRERDKKTKICYIIDE